ncbi:MAG: N-acetylmuramoyl-L-alanine amidase [Armatimonadota bacterium]|nr:N-acetylmuramoyl-L-alanine amidase [Armatimonadota bacterium]
MKTVVLDPGHGGWDSGAVAIDGRPEKDFTLSLGLAVRDELVSGWECSVVMTRETDTALAPPDNLAAELRERARVANRARADLLVSLHHDNTGNPDVRGGSLWIWTSKRNPADKSSLAWLPAAGNHTDPKTYPIAKVAVGIIRDTLAGLGVPWRSWGDPEGIACADFGVLRHTEAPAFLVECFHGSNRDDVAAARKPGFIPSLAHGIARAIAVALALPARALVWEAPMVKVILPDGREVWGTLRGDRTYVMLPGTDVEVPLRAVAEAMGCRVEWCSKPPTARVVRP